MNKPHFIIKNRFQKRGYTYRDLLKPVLKDVCQRLTGRCDYSATFDDNGCNEGRLAELQYEGKRYFITFSETEVKGGRNSSFQSVSAALNTWAIETGGIGNLYFYFLPMNGNYESTYFSFMYRLMRTAGIKFLNAELFGTNRAVAFKSVAELSRERDANRNRSKNKRNKPSYITINENGVVQVYAKTYGANKCVSTLLVMALLRLANGRIDVYQIREGGLKQLPKRSRQALDIVGGGRVQVISTDMAIERKYFATEAGDLRSSQYRSPQYMYNLLELRGKKKCLLCGCDVQEIVQGAHIWGVSQIKNASCSPAKKLEYALDGQNGIWLCANHHKLFDTNTIAFESDGEVVLRDDLERTQKDFIERTTPSMHLPHDVLTERFRFYLSKRNGDRNGRSRSQSRNRRSRRRARCS